MSGRPPYFGPDGDCRVAAGETLNVAVVIRSTVDGADIDLTGRTFALSVYKAGDETEVYSTSTAGSGTSAVLSVDGDITRGWRDAYQGVPLRIMVVEQFNDGFSRLSDGGLNVVPASRSLTPSGSPPTDLGPVVQIVYIEPINRTLYVGLGAPGLPGSLSIGAVTSLSAGSPATASITGEAPDQVLNLGIPTGANGAAPALTIGTVSAGGSPSATISGTFPNYVLNLVLAAGANGAVPNLTIGAVTTLSAGASATATITGTTTNPILNLGIPQGAAGTNGTNGNNGANGVSPNFAIGTVTTLANAVPATASITGTQANPQLNLGIPMGPGRVFGPLFPNLNAAWAANQHVVAGFMGDSLTKGWGTGSTTGNTVAALTGAYSTNLVARIVNNMNRRGINAIQGSYAFGDLGAGFTGTAANALPYYLTPTVLGAGWGNATNFQGFAGNGLTNTTDTSAATLTIAESVDRIEVRIGTAPVVGQFTISIDGNVVDTVTTSASPSAGTIFAKTYSVTKATHTISINRVSGTVYIQGTVRCWDSSVKTLQLENLGVNGLSASQVLTNSLYASNIINQGGLTGHAAIFWMLTVNDANAGRSASQIQSDMTAILTAYKTNGVDLCPVIPPPASTGSGYNLSDAQINGLYGACDAVGLMPPLDLNARYVSQAAKAGKYFDAVHHLVSGAQFDGDYFDARLMGHA